MRLTLVIYSLGCGGAERVMSLMANYWAKKDWDITLLTMNDSGVSPFYELDTRVRYIPLGLASKSRTRVAASKNNLKRIYALRRAISRSKPQVVISFMDKTNVITLLATRGLNVPVIVSEHTDPAKNSPGEFWDRVRLLIYPCADLIVVLSKPALDYFPPRLHPHIRVIPNPVVTIVGHQMQQLRASGKSSLIAMGRLVHLKGFDLLLEAFAPLKQKYPNWTLTILGEGPSRLALESLRARLGLNGRVLLPGRVKDPEKLLRQADLFVMPSRYEGFPMALCEAMAAGLPVISSACSSGAEDIVRHGVDGFLVPTENVEALRAMMDTLMADEAERKRIASRAAEVTERFGIEKIMGIWEQELCAIL